MNHEIDLSKYFVHSDLAIDEVENKDANGVTITQYDEDNARVTSVLVSKDSIIDKKEGKYVTIEFDDITDETNRNNVFSVFKREFMNILPSLVDDDLILVIGLGNIDMSADALGPLTTKNIMVTNHLYILGELDSKYKRVTTIIPGVFAETGIETSDYIKNIVDYLNPRLVIAIDALASSSISRVEKTIQMTDTGIQPGSGIGNKRKEISKEILGVDVLAIGVPMVVSASTIVKDTLEYLTRHYAYIKRSKDKPSSKLILNHNYLNDDLILDNEDRIKLLGLLGTLNDIEIKELVDDVLTPIGFNFIVSTKEVDYMVKELSNLISEVINETLHSN